MKQKKIVADFLLFLFFMWLCTLISKSIYASKLPRVTVEAPEKKKIEHVVEADGVIRQGSDIAIHTLEGLRVEKICVRAGDEVEEGTVLFQLEKEDVEAAIEAKKLEIARKEYEIADLEANQALTEADRQKEMERAKEDYAD